jgi:alpha-L-rhamnosidase
MPSDPPILPPTVSVEHRRSDDLVGIGQASPRLSWVTRTTVPGWRQTAHEIEVTTLGPGRAPGEGEGATWSAGRVDSDASVLVAWPAAPLGSRQRRAVRVRVWGRGDGGDGVGPSGWSDPVVVETGLLDPADWSARVVTPDADDDPRAMLPSPYLRTEVDLDPGAPPVQARLYVTALGVYEVEVNGHRVGDHVLAPGWTSYGHRLRYEAHDVTGLLQPGRNALGAVLADGWYRGRLGWDGGRRALYGDRLALLAQLEVVAADGTVTTYGTDGSWRSGTGAIRRSGLYEGEDHDAREEPAGWSSPGFDDGGWAPVRVLGHDADDDAGLDRLVARVGPPVRRTDELRPVAVTTSPSGRTVVDFGQNLVGRVRLRLPAGAEAGTTVTLRHAEVLEDGELCTEPLRKAEATDRYTFAAGTPAGAGWEPRFTFHGFRYAEVDGWPGELTADDLVAVVCHSDMERTGWFSCSDERVDRLHENIVWGMRGNFLDVPTDCPQRDERLGWTGDIQVFAPTAWFLHDATGFLASWLADLAADQHDDGVVPFVVPDALRFGLGASAWGDAATVVPWVGYLRSGDRDLLADQYASMTAWVDFTVRRAGDDRLWDDGFQFGDWLDPHAPAGNPFDGRTDVHLVANAYLCRSLDIVAGTAELLGETADAGRYRALAAEARAAFRREYVTPGGRLASDSQTAYALALRFDLLADEAQRARAGRRLVELVERAQHRIATGFVGTPLVSDALCDDGGPAGVTAAYRLLLQTAPPSWLHPVTLGATTVWERWDGLLPDGRVNPEAMAMNSFNHYALGAVGDWLHRRVGGLAPAEPGYRRLRIAPVVDPTGEGLTWASSRHRTPYGPAEAGWRLDGGTVEVTAVVPPNTTATVVLPFGTEPPFEVGSGEHRWTVALPPPTGAAATATPTTTEDGTGEATAGGSDRATTGTGDAGAGDARAAGGEGVG